MQENGGAEDRKESLDLSASPIKNEAGTMKSPGIDHVRETIGSGGYMEEVALIKTNQDSPKHRQRIHSIDGEITIKELQMQINEGQREEEKHPTIE